MQSMTALVIPSAHNQTLTIAQAAVPDIAADELLLEVKAVGVGIHDSYFLPQELKYPYPIGIEASGVVARSVTQSQGLHPATQSPSSA